VLILAGLSQRDHPDAVGRAFYEGDYCHAPTSHPNPNPARLAIILAGIRTNEQDSLKHCFGICEIETMFPDIDSVLRFVPFELIV
jgi:hypothetical protein